jgi:hypothetical protein
MYGFHPELTHQMAADQASAWRGAADRRRRSQRAKARSRRLWLPTLFVR